MTKEELRKEFETFCDTQWENDIYIKDFEKSLDWFYSKLEEKNNRIEELNTALSRILKTIKIEKS